MSDTSPTVLVLVPERSLRQRLIEALAHEGLEAEGAVEADELFEALESRHLDATIVHEKLPDGSGYELVYDLRRHELGAEMRAVLLTSTAWSATKKTMALQDLGLVDVCAEPVDPEQVAALLRFDLLGPASEEALADPSSHAEKRHVEAVAAAVSEEAALMRGNLADTPFPALLHQLYRQQATGALFLLKDAVKKIVYLKDGHPTYVKSNVLKECLGNVLVRERLISQRDREASVQGMRTSGRQQGSELVAMGALSPQNLVYGLELQLRTKLFDIFRWTTGEFLFRPQATLPADVIRIDLSNAGLIVEGVRRAWGAERLAAELTPYVDTYPYLSSDPELRFQQLPVDDNERAFIDAIDGSSTLQEQIERSPLPNERAAALTYALIVCGVLEVADSPTSSMAAPVARPEAGMREQLSRELQTLRERDAFGVLGVGLRADDSAVEQAYSRLARHFHPDRFRQHSAEIRQMAREIFGLIYSSYSRIDTIEKRDAYRRAPTLEEDMPSEVSQRTIMAEQRARRARELAGNARWAEARDALVEAVGLLGDAPDLRAELGWAIHMVDRDSSPHQREAIHQLRKAIELDPRHERSYLFLGRIYARLGRSLLAERQFERALQCNPHCEEALVQLEALGHGAPDRRFTGVRKPR